MEERISKVETKVEKLEDDVGDIKLSMNSLQVNCASSMTAIVTRIDEAMKHYDSMLKVLKWVVIVAVTAIATLAGVKIVIPTI